MAATLRSRLGRALLVALTPVLALGAVGAWFDYRDEAGDRRELLEVTALRSAAEAEVRLESGSLLLAALARDTTGAGCAPRLRDATARLRGYQNLIRLDARGQVRCAAAGVGTDPARASALWFRAISAGRRVAFGPAPPGMGRGGPALLAASRVEDAAGRFDGALVSIISVESLQPRLDARVLPAGAQISVVDRTGRSLSGARAVPQLASAPVDGDGVRRFRSRAADGSWRDEVAAPLVSPDVYLVLSAPAPGLFSWARLNALVTVGVPLLAFAAAFIAVFGATDRLVIRWLNYLERVAAVYARGRFSIRPQVAGDAPAEVRSLAGTLDEMAAAIVKRDAALRENIAQKDAMLREIHHRVKNNLQVITSLLNLQQRALQDPAGRAVLVDTRQRITALALIYRALYQSEDMRRIDVRSFLEELVAHLVNADSGRDDAVRATVEADEVMFDPDKLAPFALFAVEAVTNAQKHAFPSGGGHIAVTFRAVGAEGRLEIVDDGVGIDPASVSGGVGRTLMNAFARQLRGKLELTPGAEQQGLRVSLAFPLPEQESVPA